AEAAADKVVWFENANGLGNFGAEQLISDQVDGVLSVYLADFDGDGDLDVASSSFGDDKIIWFENTDGQGSYTQEHLISTALDKPPDVVANDVDNDGDLDLLAIGRDATEMVVWFENLDGSGTFSDLNIITTQVSGARYVTAGDVDGDGDDDVVYSSYNNRLVAWHENQTILGATGFTNFKFSVHPNPVAGTFTMKTNSAIATVSLYSTLGVSVGMWKATKQIDIAHLPSGTYIAEVTDAFGNTAFGKIIKN
ncbi:MAG: T9SS type A sorting domain-containing protein, partial [Marinirhabdus sp.]